MRPLSIIQDSAHTPLAPMLLSFLMHMYVCIYVCNIYKYSNHLDVLGMVIVKITNILCCKYLKTRPKAQHGPRINLFFFSRKTCKMYVVCVCVRARASAFEVYMS